MKDNLIDGRYKIISLAPQNIEEYELSNNNIMKINVVIGERKYNYRKIVFSLSKEAMIGLGYCAIRLSDGFLEGCELRTDPLGTVFPTQAMGFYLTPGSPELFIYRKEFGDLDTNKIKKNKDKHSNINNWKMNKVKFIVDMEFDDDYLEGYNIGHNNVGEIKVYEDGKEITYSGYVILYLSESALLGLGITMLRIANNYKEGDSYIINPRGLDIQNSGLGFYMTNDSPELEIRCETFENALFYDANVRI